MKPRSDDPKDLLNKPLAEMTKDEIVEAITISDHRRWKSWGILILLIVVTILAVKLLGTFAPGWSGVIPAMSLTWAQLWVLVLGVGLAGLLYIRKAS